MEIKSGGGASDGRSRRGRHQKHWADIRTSRVASHVCTWDRKVPDGENDNNKSKGLEISSRNSQEAHVAEDAGGGEGLASLVEERLEQAREDTRDRPEKK